MKNKINLLFTIIITIAFIFWTVNLFIDAQVVTGQYWWWFTTTVIVVVEKWTNIIVNLIKRERK